MKNLRPILLADDNPFDIELALEALDEFNIANRIVVVNDGAEVLEYLKYEGKFSNRKQEMPIVLLLDIKMPKLDGIEVLKILRKDTSFNSLPIVMLTSSREEQDLVRSYELGANAYVVKPVGFKEFSEAVKNIGVFWAILNELP